MKALYRRHPDLINAVVLLAAWALFFWRFAAPDPADRLTYPQGDFTLQFGVFRNIAYRQLAAGRLPLWADCLNAGYPFHADPQAQLFYPPIWLVFGFLRLGGWGHFPIEALVAETVAHYLLVSFGLYFFLRGEVHRPASALLGALTFTYSGYLTGSPPLQTATLETIAWLPLALLLARRLARSSGLQDMAWLALTLAVAFFAGHPQTFVYVTGLVFAYLVFTAHQAGVGWKKTLTWVAVLGVWSAHLTAVQLLPSLAFIRASTRASIPFTATASGFPFADILSFFVTGIVSHWQPLYVGLLPLALAGLAIAAGRNRRVWFWLVAGLATLLVSFGTRAVVYDVAYWLAPVLRLFRGQEHFALVVAFSLALLAASGADWLSGPLARQGRRTLAWQVKAAGWVMLAATLGLAQVALIRGLAQLPESFQRAPEELGRTALVAVLLAGLLTLRLRVPAARRLFPALALGLLVLDLFSANRQPNPVPLFEPFPADPLLTPVLAESGFFRVQDDFQLTGHAGCGYGFREIGSITPYRLATHANFLSEAPEPVRWQLLGVKYVASWRQYLPGPSEVIESGPGPHGETWLHRLADVEPRRAFLVHEVREGTGEAVWDGLNGEGYDSLRVAWANRRVHAEPPAGPESVEVAEGRSGQMKINVLTTSPGLLVVSEAYYPGWRAQVDGQPAPVLLVDGVLLGVPLPPGEHVVTLAYEPALLKVSGSISLLALLATVVVIMGTRYH